MKTVCAAADVVGDIRLIPTILPEFTSSRGHVQRSIRLFRVACVGQGRLNGQITAGETRE
jgi:hypothetical protein